MKRLRVLAVLPLWFLIVATGPGPTPSPSPSPTPSASPSPSPSPSPTPPPTPTPVNAFLSLDVTAGGPTTQITVTGSGFLPNEAVSLNWDPPSNKVAQSATADGSGNFTAHVQPFANDAPGAHHLCASVPPFPCANFTLQAATASPSPSPSPSPDVSPSPSPTPTPTGSPSPTPVPATLNGLDVMTRPPFVILPIIGVLGIVIALGYWVLSLARKPRPKTLKSVAVAHLATRPDYTADFGTPPPAPAPPPPAPSAWADVLPPAQPPLDATPPETPPPMHWQPPPQDLPPAPDEPPDLPEPSDY